MNSTSHVELRNVAKQFDSQKTVNQVDLVLRTGESVSMAEHNSVNKSTIMKLILDLIAPTEDKVILLGEPTGSKTGAQYRSQIGHLPETVVLYLPLAGIETMDFYTKPKKRPLSKDRELLERVNIPQATHRHVDTYSKGMRRRLALAQALLDKSKVLLFDGPTTSLDPTSRQMFYKVVCKFSGHDATVLLSTHTLVELNDHANRIIVMESDAGVTDGSVDELHVQSGLPLTVDVRLKGAHPLSGRWHPPSDGLSYQARCEAGERMALLSELDDLGSLAYIDIHTPTLDNMYTQFLKGEGV